MWASDHRREQQGTLNSKAQAPKRTVQAGERRCPNLRADLDSWTSGWRNLLFYLCRPLGLIDTPHQKGMRPFRDFVITHLSPACPLVLGCCPLPLSHPTLPPGDRCVSWDSPWAPRGSLWLSPGEGRPAGEALGSWHWGRLKSADSGCHLVGGSHFPDFTKSRLHREERAGGGVFGSNNITAYISRALFCFDLISHKTLQFQAQRR